MNVRTLRQSTGARDGECQNTQSHPRDRAQVAQEFPPSSFITTLPAPRAPGRKAYRSQCLLNGP